MSAQQMRVETISNNLANMSTTGYNARRAEFSDLHYQQMSRPGTINAADGTLLPTGIQLGLGVRPAAVSIHLSQGSLSQTNGDLDVAIDGAGYLEVTLPSGQTAFTRDGALKRNAEGLVVTSDGFSISSNITIPDDVRNISINAAGEIYGYFADAAEGELLGQLTLATFSNAKGLEALGNNLFIESEASGAAITGAPGENGTGTLRQGYLEDSSVDAVREITELIEAQRGYELNAKIISAADQMLAATTQVR
jgi:flagellar basal-body rod protein FlgG